MKKISILFVLMLALSFSVLAEGHIHTGGRTCPPCCPELQADCPRAPEESRFDDSVIDVIKNLFDFLF